MDNEKKAIKDLETQIIALKERSHYQELELTRVSTAIGEKIIKLKELIDLISTLDIDRNDQNQMIEGCLTLLDTLNVCNPPQDEYTVFELDLISKIHKKYPELNQREIRILLLIKHEHDTREIAEKVGLSTRGVESVRFRMHKKLGLGTHQSLKSFLSDFGLGQ